MPMLVDDVLSHGQAQESKETTIHGHSLWIHGTTFNRIKNNQTQPIHKVPFLGSALLCLTSGYKTRSCKSRSGPRTNPSWHSNLSLRLGCGLAPGHARVFSGAMFSTAKRDGDGWPRVSCESISTANK